MSGSGALLLRIAIQIWNENVQRSAPASRSRWTCCWLNRQCLVVVPVGSDVFCWCTGPEWQRVRTEGGRTPYYDLWHHYRSLS